MFQFKPSSPRVKKEFKNKLRELEMFASGGYIPEHEKYIWKLKNETS